MFIDNEIRSKQVNQNLKFNSNNEIQFKICFEETFVQKQNNKNDFPSSNIVKTNKKDNLNKSISPIVVSINKIPGKLRLKKSNNTHSKVYKKERIRSNKLSNNSFYFSKKFYSIKNVPKESRTFLVLNERKYATGYLKTLCNNLKKFKNNNKTEKHVGVINLKTKLVDLNQNKKVHKITNKIKNRKSKKSSQYIYPLFKKPLKKNFAMTSKYKNSRANSVLIKIKQNE